jgi:hypothetical protein
MSLHHFLDTNQKTLEIDLLEINPNLPWEQFYSNASYTCDFVESTNYLEKCLENEEVVSKYWIYKLEKYFTLHSSLEQTYPLVYSSYNIVNSYEIDSNNIDGVSVSDKLKLYDASKMIEFEICAYMGGSYSDGIRMEVTWYIIPNKKSKDFDIEILNEVLNNEKEIDRLGEMNKLWKLLDEESWIQKSLVKPKLK